LVTFIKDDEALRLSVPDGVVDLESFRRWLDSDDVPEKARIWYLRGEVWVDMSREQVYTHGLVKTEIAFALTGVVKARKRGIYLTDGILLSNEQADISGKPDGLFISAASQKAKRVTLVEGMERGYVEVEGAPDMVLEVVSDGSVHKDTVFLRQAYWEAGIPEYWLVDARESPLSFNILRHTDKGYVAARKQKGWVKSLVFGKSFRLTQESDTLGNPSYTLAVR
jgi:Uma2 family endonuclease